MLIPLTEARLGIVEWKNGSATVFLAVGDFSVPCGAYAAVGIGAAGIAVIGTLSLLLVKKRRYVTAP